jgi:hypothetical protein
VALHSSLSQIHDIRDAILFFLRETAAPEQVESVLGTWCLASHDVDRPVAVQALKSWLDAFAHPQGLRLNETFSPPLISFLQRTLIDPLAVYLYLNPVARPAGVTPSNMGGRGNLPPVPKKGTADQTPQSKPDAEEENENDRKARLRVGALGAIQWMLGA